MSEPFISEIKIFSFNFPPRGWALCNGQLLPIAQNSALFSLLGTTYGGNGQTTFALPNLQGRTPLHFGSGFVLGQAGGEMSHTLNVAELPAHAHAANASSAAATATSPAGNLWANGNVPAYTDPGGQVMNPAALANVGGSQPHENMPPYLVLNFCIALQGIFPSRY
ncbi:MAG: tail fiber protein [Anaerolineaceae bacterium]